MANRKKALRDVVFVLNNLTLSHKEFIDELGINALSNALHYILDNSLATGKVIFEGWGKHGKCVSIEAPFSMKVAGDRFVREFEEINKPDVNPPKGMSPYKPKGLLPKRKSSGDVTLW